MPSHPSHAGFYSSVVPPWGQRCKMRMKKGWKVCWRTLIVLSNNGFFSCLPKWEGAFSLCCFDNVLYCLSLILFVFFQGHRRYSAFYFGSWKMCMPGCFIRSAMTVSSANLITAVVMGAGKRQWIHQVLKRAEDTPLRDSSADRESIECTHSYCLAPVNHRQLTDPSTPS